MINATLKRSNFKINKAIYPEGEWPYFFKVQEIIKFSEAESKMISSFQPLNMLNLLIIN